MIDPTRTTILRTQAVGQLGKKLTRIQQRILAATQDAMLSLVSPITALEQLKQLVTRVVNSEINLDVMDEFLLTAYRRAAQAVVRQRYQTATLLLGDTSFGLVRQIVHNDVEALRANLTNSIVHKMGERTLKPVTTAVIVAAVGPAIASARAIAARRLVDTAIVKVHNEAILDALEYLGEKRVSVLVEVRISGDGKVCPICSGYRNRILTISQARGVFPIHPSCRCSIVPVARTLTKLRLLTNG